jgi:hypothetical protein
VRRGLDYIVTTVRRDTAADKRDVSERKDGTEFANRIQQNMSAATSWLFGTVDRRATENSESANNAATSANRSG